MLGESILCLPTSQRLERRRSMRRQPRQLLDDLLAFLVREIVDGFFAGEHARDAVAEVVVYFGVFRGLEEFQLLASGGGAAASWREQLGRGGNLGEPRL